MELLMCCLAFALAADLPAAQRTNSPNVVISRCDVLGYGDLGCFGAKEWRTPNLDRAAKDGVRFTRFHVSQPVCSASRAGLMTGCYPGRVGESDSDTP